MIKKILVAFFVLSACLSANDIEEGKKIFTTKKIGNCLSCHNIKGHKINQPGSLGPTLSGLKYWPKDVLFKKVYDATASNPLSPMPPLGANKLLTDKQIHQVVAFLKTID